MYIGIATLDTKNEMTITKLASDIVKKIDCIDRIDELAPGIHKGSRIGIGHTRWATCGEKTDCNAHPHTDSVIIITICTATNQLFCSLFFRKIE